MNFKHYFKIGSYGFWGTEDYSHEFIIDMESNPWRLFERRMNAPDTNWKEVACDQEKLYTYLMETAQPGTWEDRYARPRTIDMMVYSFDGAVLQAEWDFGNGLVKRSYGSYERHESEMAGVQESTEMLKWLKDSFKQS